jgi:hypothetical protein
MNQTAALKRLPPASPTAVGVMELPATLTRIFTQLEREEEEREEIGKQRQEPASQPRRVPRPFAYD